MIDTTSRAQAAATWDDFRPVIRKNNRGLQGPFIRINSGGSSFFGTLASQYVNGAQQVEPLYQSGRKMLGLRPCERSANSLKIARRASDDRASVGLGGVLKALGYPPTFKGVFEARPFLGGIVIDLSAPVDGEQDA